MNRKSLLLCVLIVLLALLATACQSSQPKAARPLQEALDSVLSDRAELVMYTADDLYDILGIAPETYTEAAYMVGSDSLSGREVIAVRAKDAAALKATAQALSAYLEQRKEETRNYLPEAYQLQSAAKVETKHLTAVLIVGQQAAAETKAFLAGE